MILTLPNLESKEINSLQEACKEFKKAYDENPIQDIEESAGDVTGANLYIGKVYPNGDLYVGNKWPYVKKLIDFKNIE